MKCDIDIRKDLYPTLYCQEEPPCTQVLLIVCRRRSPPWLPAPSKSRSSPHQRGSTPAGSEDPSSPHSPHSNRCGSLRLSMMSLVHPSPTASASNLGRQRSYKKLIKISKKK